MFRIYAMFLLTFSFLNNLVGQETKGSFYWQLYPNYTFAQVSKNSENINAKIVSLPFLGLGLGYHRKIGETIRADVSLNLHGVSCRFQSIPVNNSEMTYVPMISGNLYFPTKPNSKGHFLFLRAGANLSYEVGSQSLFIITDTVNNRIATLTTERENRVNFFGSLGAGVYFKRPKRDISLSLQFNKGFKNTYKAGITVQENQNETFAEIVSKDSFLGFQCKFFFKKR